MSLPKASRQQREADIEDLISSLAAAQSAVESASAGHADPVVEPSTAPGMLLRRAQIALTESESRYRRLVSRMSELVFELDMTGTILFVNDAVTAMTGYTPGELIGGSWGTRLAADGNAGVEALIERSRRGDVRHVELTVVTRAGVPVTLDVSSANAYRPDGTLGRVACIAVESAVHARAERESRQREPGHSESELRRSAERREFVLTASGIGLWEDDLATGEISWSDTMGLVHGIPRDAFPRTRESMYARLHPDDRQEFIRSLERAVQDGTGHQIEYRSVWPDGSVHWIESQARVIRGADGRPSRLLGVERDITQHTLAELERIESERAYRSTFEAGPVGIAHVSLVGQFLRVNQRLCDLLGFTRGEMLALDFQTLTHPDDLAQDLAAIDQLVDGTLSLYIREKRYRRRDGTFLWVNVNVGLHRDVAGQAQYFISTIEDITERKSLEEQFRHAQKMDAIGQLAGGVAHDFDNVLTAILGFSELILGDLGGDDPIRPDVEEILNAGKRGARITRQLLAFSRRQAMEPQNLNLALVVSGMESMLRRLIGGGIHLVIHTSGAPAMVTADRGQIEQILMNLVVNARDAMARKGVLTIEVSNVTLAPEFAAAHQGAVEGPFVRLSVSDTGVGMDPTVLAHLFEPFYTTKEKGKGTGLGLAIVNGVVKQSHGFLAVTSEPGRGTTFEIYLPDSLPQPAGGERSHQLSS